MIRNWPAPTAAHSPGSRGAEAASFWSGFSVSKFAIRSIPAEVDGWIRHESNTKPIGYFNPGPTHCKNSPNLFSTIYSSLKLPAMPFNTLKILSLHYSLYFDPRTCQSSVARPRSGLSSLLLRWWFGCTFVAFHASKHQIELRYLEMFHRESFTQEVTPVPYKSAASLCSGFVEQSAKHQIDQCPGFGEKIG